MVLPARGLIVSLWQEPPLVLNELRRPGRTSMRKLLLGLIAAFVAVSAAHAQDTVKIGLIMPYSGQFADAAAQMDNAIKLYVKQNGDIVAGRKLEFIRRDTGGVAP